MSILTDTDWNDPEIIETIRKTVCPPNITEPEFKLFILTCQQSGMNPLTKDIFCTKNKGYTDKNGVAHEGQLNIMVGINGLLRRADRHPQYDGMDPPDIVLDGGGKPVSCLIRVYRKDRSRPVAYTAYFAESVRPNPYGKEGTWEKMPIRMLEKCAKAGALREAFPNEFGGLYLEEEVGEEAPPLEIKTPAERRAERKAQTVEAAKSLPQSAESLEISQPPGDRYIYRIPEATDTQRQYLEQHGAIYDEYDKVWVAKADLGSKLSKYKITLSDLVPHDEPIRN